MKITFRQLEYLLALAEEAHFGRAAERAGVSQPALSQQIREIEAHLGAELVERGRQVKLSRAGEQVVAKASPIIALMTDLERMAPHLDRLSGPLRLGIIPTVAPYLLPRILSMFPEGETSVQVLEALTERVLSELGTGGIDAVICALPVDAPEVVSYPLFDDRFLYAIRKGDPAPRGLKPAAIPGDRLLLLDDGHCLADQALSICGLRRGPASLGAASLTTIARMVAEGHGVTLLPEIAAGVEGQGLDLHRFAEPEPLRTIGLVIRESSSGQRWTRELRELLVAASIDAGSKPQETRRRNT
ncbi:MAG: hydrogen peroxide-inducible genes activator [Pseudomonadota bacterium]